MTKFFWKISTSELGVSVTCYSKGLISGARPVLRDHWPKGKGLSGRGLLDFLIKSEKANGKPDGALLAHDTVSKLTSEQADLLDLPPIVPFALQVKSHGTVDSSDFSLVCSWNKLGHTPVQIERIGSILRHGNALYRLPEQLLSVVESVEAFNIADTTGAREDRVKHWLPIQNALERATGTPVQPDGYIGELKIFHAASLSLTVDISKEDGVTFDPVLFGRSVERKHKVDLFESDPLADPALENEWDDENSAGVGVDSLVDEAEQLLPPELHKIFLRKRFDADAICREAYPLGANAYVIFDPQLRKALDVVKQKQKASAEDRRTFVKNPRVAFAEALETPPDSRELIKLFMETNQYAARVTDIGLWTPKVLPWLPRASNSWLPEKIGFSFGGKNVEIEPEELDAVKQACEEAMEKGDEVFSYGGVPDIPVHADTLAAINSLRPYAESMIADMARRNADERTVIKDKNAASERYALTIEDNLEDLNYQSRFTPRECLIEAVPPHDMINADKLFPHQREGFDWMVKSWKLGRPGILLADDMGLGKTVQTLAFAAWLDYQKTCSGSLRGPFLIVAPTALLRNWRAEHDKHLLSGGLEPIVELYGSTISSFRKDGENGRDVTSGHGVLDRERLAQASVILTTYETLANYHMSFAATPFPLVIFDEIQKLKTPTTINTHAAKTINADFVIGLTGTPVENNLTELWSIMDRVHPGFFDDLKSFNQNYSATNASSLRLLRDKLVSIDLHHGQIMLRRMKDTTDLGRALPAKELRSIPIVMPELQAKAYAKVVAGARRAKIQGANRGMMLKVLQEMRGISLHPEHPLTVLGRPDRYNQYIDRSARLIGAISALDEVVEKGEKALVFIEFRVMQELFADILRQRYNLEYLPAIINGQTPSAKRQVLVEQFQSKQEGRFDVMVLAPRAAGLGLTITAANHIIHLSRWWNPAVEDQCNDRAYRIGQDKTVTVYCPIARHPAFGDKSFDVTLDNLLTRKRALSRDLLLPMESEDDYREMFDETLEPGPQVVD